MPALLRRHKGKRYPTRMQAVSWWLWFDAMCVGWLSLAGVYVPSMLFVSEFVRLLLVLQPLLFWKGDTLQCQTTR